MKYMYQVATGMAFCSFWWGLLLIPFTSHDHLNNPNKQINAKTKLTKIVQRS